MLTDVCLSLDRVSTVRTVSSSSAVAAASAAVSTELKSMSAEEGAVVSPVVRHESEVAGVIVAAVEPSLTGGLVSKSSRSVAGWKLELKRESLSTSSDRETPEAASVGGGVGGQAGWEEAEEEEDAGERLSFVEGRVARRRED